MAFVKYAKAQVVKPQVTLDGWHAFRTAAESQTGHPYRDAPRTAAENIALQEYDPNQFMLSHCTIIASVDTEEASDPLGVQMVDGFQIDRRFADWQVTPNTVKYINNNNDCWERKLLLSSFRTFVGGENYVEHIQIPELSKGKIIDAASRDIGDSIYVDILVATDRRHAPLISAITTGRLQTLSMGCQVEFTICTKCGNVAKDEAQLCPHIRYMKGNDYFDALGNKRKIAELCGHITAEPGSVKFIEASWVANPAFTGAVLRSILQPSQVRALGDRIQVAFNEPTRTADPTQLQKAARKVGPTHFRTVVSEDFDFGDPLQDEAPAEETKKEENPLEKAINDLVDDLKEKAIGKIREQMGEGKSERVFDDRENTNNTLVKEACKHPEWRRIAAAVLKHTPNRLTARRMVAGLVHYKRGGWFAVRDNTDLTKREMLALSRIVDRLSSKQAMAGEGRVYRAILATGGPARFSDMATYVEACAKSMGRAPNQQEIKALVLKGRIYECGV
jgi:hypothetical protein